MDHWGLDLGLAGQVGLSSTANYKNGARALLYTLLHKMVSHVHKIINIWTHTIVLSAAAAAASTIGRAFSLYHS